MFKLVVLSALLVAASTMAAPDNLLLGTNLGHRQTLVSNVYTPIRTEIRHAHVGSIVERVPTAVSHQSQTVVHSDADRVTHIVAPISKTIYSAPLYNTISTQHAVPTITVNRF